MQEIEPSIIKLRGASQITLPREIRNAIELAEGDYLEASVTQEGILLKPVTIRSRMPSAADEDLIQSVVDEVRAEYAKKRSH